MQKYNGQLINQFPNSVSGNAAAGAQITVRVKSSGALASLYATDSLSGAALSNPLTADSRGYYGFYAPDGVYTLDVSISGTPQLEIQLQDVASLQDQFNDALANAGYIPIGTFSAGCTVSQSNGVVSDGSSFWRWDGALPKTVTAGSAPTPTGVGSWVLVGGNYVETDALAAADSAVLVGGVEAKWFNTSGIFTTTTEIASGAFPVGSVLCVTDRANAIFIVQSGGAVDGKGVISAGGTNAAYFDSSSFEEYNPEFFGATTAAADITAFVQYAINLVGAQDPFAANPTGITIKFPSKYKFNVTGTLLLPSYVRIDLNGSTLLGNGSNTMFETAYWSGGSLVTNFGQPNETRFVVNSQITNGRISNCNAFRLFNFCESSIVENIRLFGCNQAVYALRCFYGSFRQLHARSPLDGLVTPCFHFESAMGALEAAQVYANGYQRGLLVSGNKDNMVLSNFSAETCPIGISVENATSAITFERGYFEGNFNSISLATTANHANVVVDGCWFLGTTNAIEATTVLSGTFRENNVLNGANVSLQNNFSCRMTVEIPTDVTADNAVYAVPSNYLLGTANNVKYIKQVYDSATGLVEFKCDVHAGPIPHSYGGTSGKLIQGQIPFCVSTLTATTLTIDTKIVYQSHEFIGIYVNVNSLSCGGTVLAGQMLNTITSTLTITPSNNGGFYRFVISGFTGGSTFSGSVRVL